MAYLPDVPSGPAVSASAARTAFRPAVYDFGDFRLDSARHRLLLKSDGRALPLTAKAFETPWLWCNGAAISLTRTY